MSILFEKVCSVALVHILQNAAFSDLNALFLSANVEFVCVPTLMCVLMSVRLDTPGSVRKCAK